MFTRLIIDNYKKFTHEEIDFSIGLNVIYGHNEAGKSTIMSALLAVLHQDAQTKSRQFIQSIKSWHSGEAKTAKLQLELEVDGQKYVLTRDYGTGSQSLKTSSGEVITDFQSIQRKLDRDLHIPTKEVLLATSYIGQSEISKIEFSADIRSALQRVSAMNPQGVDLESGISELEKELQQLQLGLLRPSKNPGIIKSTQLEIAQLTASLEQKNSLWERMTTAKQTMLISTDKLGGVKQKLAEVEANLTNNKKLEDANKRLDLLNGQLSDITGLLSQVDSINLQVKQLESQLKLYPQFSQQTETITEELQKLRHTEQLVHDNYNDLQAQYTQQVRAGKLNYLPYTESKQQDRLYYIAAGLTLCMSVIMLGLGSAYAVPWLLAAGAIIAAISVVGAVYLWFKGKTKNIRPDTTVQDNQTEQLHAQLESTGQKLTEIHLQQQQIISKFGVSDYDEFFNQKAKYNTLKSELSRLLTLREGYLQDKNEEQLRSQQTNLLKQKHEIEVNEITPEVKAAALTPSEYLAKRRELDMLIIEQNRLTKESTAGEVRSTDITVDRNEIIELEEKLVLSNERLQHLQQRVEILGVTIRLLKESLKTTSVSAGKLVSDVVEEFLPKLTLQRYKDMRLTEGFDLEVFSSEINDWIKPLGQLSLGTVDQIYFLVRYGLGRVLLGGKLDYLFLDDPFVTFDAQRLTQTQDILQSIAQDTQVLLFTHNQLYTTWGRVIKL